MKKLASLMLGTLLFACAKAATADAYWNDAVSTGGDGKRVVELPPKNPNPGHILKKRPTSWEPPTPTLTHVMEGPRGLVECMQAYYREDGTCNDYTPGQYKQPRKRVWSVKRDGTWWQCSTPQTRNTCAKSWTACTGDAGSPDKCIPLYPGFKDWLTPAKLQP